MDDKAGRVSERNSQLAEAVALRAKAEPVVWTDSMLQALVRGVRGGKWHSLIDKVWRKKTLRRAWERVKSNDGAPGVDGQTIEDFERHLDSNLERLSAQLRGKKYEPKAVRRTWIPKPGKAEQRPLGIPTVADRVVQMACQIVLEPIYEHGFAEQSYGFRKGRSAKDALRRVHQMLKEGKRWVVDADLKSYFDTIPHDQLMERVGQKVSDGSIHELIRQFLGQEVVDGEDRYQPEQGTPQGGVISPLLANIYLDPLDHLMAKQGYEMVRYADDFVILCDTREEAERARKVVEEWTTESGLTLHPEKTSLVEAQSEEGFTFLGYHFHEGRKEPRRKSTQKFRDEIRALTKRTNGHKLETVIEDINSVAEGWFEYFKHSVQSTSRRADQFIRQRLRAMLRRRDNLRGMVNPKDYKRWPNSFFAGCGLFSMEQARKAILQSLF